MNGKKIVKAYESIKCSQYEKERKFKIVSDMLSGIDMMCDKGITLRDIHKKLFYSEKYNTSAISYYEFCVFYYKAKHTKNSGGFHSVVKHVDEINIKQKNDNKILNKGYSLVLEKLDEINSMIESGMTNDDVYKSFDCFASSGIGMERFVYCLNLANRKADYMSSYFKERNHVISVLNEINAKTESGITLGDIYTDMNSAGLFKQSYATFLRIVRQARISIGYVNNKYRTSDNEKLIIERINEINEKTKNGKFLKDVYGEMHSACLIQCNYSWFLKNVRKARVAIGYVKPIKVKPIKVRVWSANKQFVFDRINEINAKTEKGEFVTTIYKEMYDAGFIQCHYSAFKRNVKNARMAMGYVAPKIIRPKKVKPKIEKPKKVRQTKKQFVYDRINEINEKTESGMTLKKINNEYFEKELLSMPYCWFCWHVKQARKLTGYVIPNKNNK